MTNKHCDNCGDLLSRYKGQVFCSTCQAKGQATVNVDQDAEQTAEAAVKVDENEAEAEARVDASETVASVGSTGAADETRHNPADANGRTAAPIQARTTGERGATERCALREVAGDMITARESLAWALTQTAEQAGSTNDPQRATRYLIAIREAAEVISVLDR